MPQLGFKKQLAPKVLSGEKPFTLRNLRLDRRDPKTGDMLYMFTGLRTKECQKFGEKLCRFAVNIKLSFNLVQIPNLRQINDPAKLELFSRFDGFDNYETFKKFHRIIPGMSPKEMRLIAWITCDELKKALNL
jgi:hypothetical protein